MFSLFTCQVLRLPPPLCSALPFGSVKVVEEEQEVHRFEKKYR